MRRKRPVKTEKRAVSTLLRRRIGVVVGLVFVWATVVWVVLSFPYARAIRDGSEARTSYGVLRWFEVTDIQEQVGIASFLPLHVVGTSRFHPMSAMISMAICVAVTVLIVAYARRWLRNLRPRWLCKNCGYNMSAGDPRSSVCPECGEPPNLHWRIEL